MGNEALSRTKKSTKEITSTPFIDNIQKILTSKKLITLFSQDFQEIRPQQELLKQKMEHEFQENFFHLRIPRVKNSESRYFELLAKDCAFSARVKSVDDWYRELSTKLSENQHQKIFFYITDIENGDEEQNRNFAEIIRSLQSEFKNFYAILVGKEKLASLVYGKDSKLSPLKDIAQKMFFEDVKDSISLQDVRQELQALQNNGEKICDFLDDELKIRWDYYSGSVLNRLFWKNLMFNDKGYYQWRNEETKEMAKEIFGC